MLSVAAALIVGPFEAWVSPRSALSVGRHVTVARTSLLSLASPPGRSSLSPPVRHRTRASAKSLITS